MRRTYSFVALAALSVVLAALSFIYSTNHANSLLAQLRQQQRQEQAAQQRQGAVFETRLCASLGRLAALQPPGGSPANNPSRAYLQGQHDVLAQLGPDVGCGGKR